MIDAALIILSQQEAFPKEGATFGSWELHIFATTQLMFVCAIAVIALRGVKLKLGRILKVCEGFSFTMVKK